MRFLPSASLKNSAALATLAGFLLATLTVAGVAVDRASGQEVDESPLPIEMVRTYANLQLRRPIVVTHAGDNSGRTFVASQYGVIQLLPADRQAEEAPVYMDMEHKVMYKDKENEEGFLGLAFHPKFRENGEFFVYYTTRDEPHTSIVSRFRAASASAAQADPGSEQVLLRIPQPFWNHNGGNIAFGPDGYLYISLGDGGSANDPMGNGQNLQTWLGSILRIDVDGRDPDKPYAVPRDNPFVDRAEAREEIWAYGLRNVWGSDRRAVGRRRGPGFVGRDQHHHARWKLWLESA
jgi:glucose/arabinose dehydrogenase